MVIGIIGGGASGMAAALAAAQEPNVQVIIFERQSRVGRKLQATGNGRCNLTNKNCAIHAYHGADASFASPSLKSFDVDATLAWFASLGLLTVAESSGRVYPYCDQANSVVDVLRLALNKDNIRLLTGFEVQKIKKTGIAFQVFGEVDQFVCDKLIIACGGLAGTKLGGTMSGYKLLRSFGHKCTPLRPALVQIKSDWSALTSLKGVRANCHAQILHDGKLFSESRGELQFTQHGVSGPVIFEISRDVCREKGDWVCRLDFLPQLSREALCSVLLARKHSKLLTDELLTGILHNRLGRVLTKEVNIRSNVPIASLNDAQIRLLAAAVKGFDISLSEPFGMDSAQVTAGGIITEDFDPYTLQSRLVSGLYACGEVLDIDGDCGGYNLQWAWSSGYCAGLHAGKENR